MKLRMWNGKIGNEKDEPNTSSIGHEYSVVFLVDEAKITSRPELHQPFLILQAHYEGRLGQEATP